MKKFLSILLAAMLVFSMGTLAFAAEEAYEAESTTVAAAEDTTAAATTEAVKEDGVKGEGELTALEEKIAEKGLDTTDMTSLFSSAIKSIGEDLKDISIEEILSLPADVMDDVVTFIFSALKTLGVDVDAFYEKLSSNKIINWFVNTFYKGNALTTTPATEIPQTGSTASVAVFATLSLAAAAAFVSFKKKEA
ncbi:MAG: LPXTG cell wall anchor domain-containing protein [Clostridia bacterium]|nr:LPXTG cell wall anchor domain-containing protein [Clostridia bacterium]